MEKTEESVEELKHEVQELKKKVAEIDHFAKTLINATCLCLGITIQATPQGIDCNVIPPKDGKHSGLLSKCLIEIADIKKRIEGNPILYNAKGGVIVNPINN